LERVIQIKLLLLTLLSFSFLFSVVFFEPLSYQKGTRKKGLRVKEKNIFQGLHKKLGSKLCGFFDLDNKKLCILWKLTRGKRFPIKSLNEGKRFA